MGVTCPVCGEHIPGALMPWARWRCGSCGSTLGYSTKRALLFVSAGMALVTATNYLWVLKLPLRLAASGTLVVIYCWVVARFANLIVQERRVSRCRICGHELTGDEGGTCPKCGTELVP